MRNSLHQLSLFVGFLLLTLPLTVWSTQCTDQVSCSFGCLVPYNCQCGWTDSDQQEDRFFVRYGFPNYYLYVNMGNRSTATLRYSSPVICGARNKVHSFQLRYSLKNEDGCEMTVYLKNAKGTKLLWNNTALIKSTSFEQLSPVDIEPQEEDFQIIIEIKKLKTGGCGEVRFDDIEYEFLRDVTTTPRGRITTVSSPESRPLQSTLLFSNMATLPTTSANLYKDISTSSKSSTFETSSYDFDEQSTKEGETGVFDQTGSSEQLENESSGLLTGVGLAVLITAVISASVAIAIVRKKRKMSSDTCTRTPLSATETTAIRASSNEHLSDNANYTQGLQELSTSDGGITANNGLTLGVPGEPVLPRQTTHDGRVTSFGDHVNGGSWQTSFQEDYTVLFGTGPRQPVTDYFELDTYNRIPRQSETDVPGDNATPRKGVVDVEQQRHRASSSELNATPDAENGYGMLRTSLNTDEAASGHDVYDHLENEKQSNVTNLCATADVYVNAPFREKELSNTC